PALDIEGVSMSPIRIDKDGLPTATFSIQMDGGGGRLEGELSLEELWRMVDRIRIGRHGFALIVASDGTLLAHGDADRKALVALSRNMGDPPLVRAVQASKGSPPVSSEYTEGGVAKLGV